MSMRVPQITYNLRREINKTVPLVVMAGKGHNAANGIAAARILLGRGRRRVSVLLAFARGSMAPMAQQQLRLFQRVGGQVLSASVRTLLAMQQSDESGVLVDALLGTGVSRPPSGVLSTLIDVMNASTWPVLALDVPSGLHHHTGEVMQPCVVARWTFCFHVPKSGYARPSARAVLGQLWTADTGLTYTVWHSAGVSTEAMQQLYADAPIRRL